MCERGLSQRRACGLIGVSRSTVHYELRMPLKDAPLVEVMRELAAQYPRFGYRRIRILLRRSGHNLSWERTYRLWSKAQLQLPRRRPRRRAAKHTLRSLSAVCTNFVWTYDFVFDACANGQQLKCLTVVDEFTRECLHIDVAGSIRSARVIEVLEKLISVHGRPQYLRSDNGPEFVSHRILQWLEREQIDTALIDPGKPWQNGTGESFNGKLRDECLALEWFRSRAEARVLIESWRRHYNETRPHSSLNYLTPLEFKRQHSPDINPAVFQE